MMGHGSRLMDDVGFWMHFEALGRVFGVFWTDLGDLEWVWVGSGRFEVSLGGLGAVLEGPGTVLGRSW